MLQSAKSHIESLEVYHQTLLQTRGGLADYIASPNALTIHEAGTIVQK